MASGNKIEVKRCLAFYGRDRGKCRTHFHLVYVYFQNYYYVPVGIKVQAGKEAYSRRGSQGEFETKGFINILILQKIFQGIVTIFCLSI